MFCLCLIYLLDSLCQVIEQFWYLYAQTSLHFKPETFENGSKGTKDDITWCRRCNDPQMSHTTFPSSSSSLVSHRIIFMSSNQAEERRKRRKWFDSAIRSVTFTFILTLHKLFISSNRYSGNKVFSKQIDDKKVFFLFGCTVESENSTGSNKKSSYTINLPVRKGFRFSWQKTKYESRSLEHLHKRFMWCEAFFYEIHFTHWLVKIQVCRFTNSSTDLSTQRLAQIKN